MKKIFVLALALAMFLCGCQSQPDDTMLSYDGPYVDLIAVDVPEMADGEVSIIKVDSETGYPVASTITKKNGDKTVQERVFPRFDYEGTETAPLRRWRPDGRTAHRPSFGFGEADG